MKSQKFLCDKCKHEFYSSEDKVIIECPVCRGKVVNKYKLINTDNFLFIEAMLKNIETYGKEETLKMIDKNYHNPIVRARIRKMFFDTLDILEKI